MTGLMQDLRAAWRQLRRSPAFVTAALATLAFGLGINVALASMLNALLLRPLPIHDPHGLVAVSGRSPTGELRATPIPAVAELGDGPLVPLCGLNDGALLAVDVAGVPTLAVGGFVTGQCFAVLGVQPLHGRLLTDVDASLFGRGQPVVVLGHRFWVRAFGGDPEAVGKTLRIEGETLTVVGILPATFDGVQIDSATDLYAPFGTIFPDPPGRRPGAAQLLGRLRAGVTFDEAAAEIATRWPAVLAVAVPETMVPAARDELRAARPRVERLGTGLSFYRERYARPLTLVWMLTSVLLALTCANLGGLMFARVSARGHEIAVRTALGGGAWRVSRMLLVESMVLALGGVVLALPISRAVVVTITALLPPGNVPRTIDYAPDAIVLAGAAMVAVSMALVMTLLPLWITRGRQLRANLVARRAVAGATSRWGRRLLVVEVALSTVLLAVASLLGRSLYLLQHQPTGVRAEGVVAVSVLPRPGAYRALVAEAYYPPLLAQLAALPGVRRVGSSRMFPRMIIDSGGQPIGFVGDAPGDMRAMFDVASPGFFAVVGIPLLAGRELSWADTAQSAPVAIVSASLARRLAADWDVIGRHVRFGAQPSDQDVTIVGIVGDATQGNPRSAAVPVLYRPLLQAGAFANFPSIVLAVDGDIAPVAAAVRQVLDGGGREYAQRIEWLADVLARAPASERMSTAMAIAIGALAALLTAIGLHGHLAYQVALREREFGVRLAVGATPARITRMVMTDGTRLALAGLVLGAPAALWAAHSLEALTFGVTAVDRATVAMVVALILAVAAVAGLAPARRAAAVDPAESLRAE
jgi:predicted permease